MKLRLLLLLLFLSRSLTEPSPAAPQDEQEDLHQGCGPESSPEQQRAVGGAVERLGLTLLQNLQVQNQQPNVVLSPLSLALTLAQLSLGARNATLDLLLRSLHAHALPCYHQVLGGLLPRLHHTSLEVAARMYLRPGFEVKPSFVEDSVSRYRSRPVPLVSVEDVNQWVENATDGHISNFLESVPQDVVLMLMNAVYFKGEWQTRFDPLVTSKGVFYLDDQNSVSVDMMKSAQYPLRLLDDPHLEAQVASFPFRGNSSFLVVLPRGNVSSLLPRLNLSDLHRRLPPEKTMQVHLPRVRLQYRQDLEGALRRMGLASLFSGPDLSGISDRPLRVTGVRHAATVELREDGVEASAVSVVTSMRSVSLFSVSSPFFFALLDDASLAPLFMGVVTNPAPDNDAMLNDAPHGNGTASDQPESRGTRPAGGCGAPSGRHGNGLDGACSDPDQPVPA